MRLRRLYEPTALRKHSQSFYWASLWLDAATANEITQLYAFCRCVDDWADKEPNKQQAAATLQSWLRQLQTQTAIDPPVQAILALAKKKQLNLVDLCSLVQGVLSDLKGVCMADEDQLTRYCYLVAGTVGLLMAQLLGAQDVRAKRFAIDLGIAMQLTNILRDVAEDARAGRQYIPQTWLPSDYDQHTIKPALMQLFALSEAYYASGYAGLRYLPWRHRWCILYAARLYQEIGLQAQRNGFNVLQQRTVVSTQRKISLLVVCWLRFIKDYLWPSQSPVHNSHLHRALAIWVNRL